METNELSRIIVDTAHQIQAEVGPGLLESVYEVLLADALIAAGYRVERHVAVPVRIGTKTFEEGFRADLIVEGRVIVEVQSVEHLAPVHKKQLLTQLKLSGISAGLLINFGGERMHGNVERLVTSDAPDIKQHGTDQPQQA